MHNVCIICALVVSSNNNNKHNTDLVSTAFLSSCQNFHDNWKYFILSWVWLNAWRLVTSTKDSKQFIYYSILNEYANLYVIYLMNICRFNESLVLFYMHPVDMFGQILDTHKLKQIHFPLLGFRIVCCLTCFVSIVLLALVYFLRKDISICIKLVKTQWKYCWKYVVAK